MVAISINSIRMAKDKSSSVIVPAQLEMDSPGHQSMSLNKNLFNLKMPFNSGIMDQKFKKKDFAADLFISHYFLHRVKSLYSINFSLIQKLNLIQEKYAEK